MTDKISPKTKSQPPFEPNSEIYIDLTERRSTLKSRKISGDNESFKDTTHLKSLFEKHSKILKDSTLSFNEENKENKPTGLDLNSNSSKLEQLTPPEIFRQQEPTKDSYEKLLECYQWLWDSIY